MCRDGCDNERSQASFAGVISRVSTRAVAAALRTKRSDSKSKFFCSASFRAAP